jgi:ribosome biogenesis GTPase A
MASTSTLSPARFIPRLKFYYPNKIHHWHPGHMKGFMDRMAYEVADIDLIIECRDARLPLTSINPRLEEVVNEAWGPGWRDGNGLERGRRRNRLVVYTKSDLAEERFEEVRHGSYR